MTETDWSSWIGRTQEQSDAVDVERARALQATLDESGPRIEEGSLLPPLWHWIYFWEIAPTAGLGPEGHAKTGAFLPPLDLPRRMWGGSRLTFAAPIRVGERLRRESKVADVRVKEARSGRLGIVTLSHRLFGEDGDPRLIEEKDILFRPAPKPGEAAPEGERASEATTWRQVWHPSPVLLFRYSALTFNSHRIHFDRRYTVETEGYPGLLVHGPLLATLMLELVRRNAPNATVASFAFRARRPVYDSAPFTVSGDLKGARVDLTVADPDGLVAMQGEATLA